MSFKKIIGKIHLWLGLTSGLVVFIISVTGCLYAFQEEISELTQPFRYVQRQEKPFLSPSILKTIAERVLPGKKIHSVQYADRGYAAIVSFYDYDPEYYYLVFVNPFTGQVLKVKDMYSDFFHFVLQGHYYLWLPPSIGQPVVASATLVFVIMLVTGIILWWPKRKKARQRFSIKWNARWRRRNYDLHSVLGFYVMWIAIILALTGLVWGFEWFGNTVYRIAGGDKKEIYLEPVSQKQYASFISPTDKLWEKMKSENPQEGIIELHFPESDTASIAVTINPDPSTYWKSDYRFFDQYSLNEIPVDQVYGKLTYASAADKLIRMNYDIHTGAILGLPGKVFAFLASLLCASLPITGFYIWWGRLRKNQHKFNKSLEIV
jgi:uncharacterized iron-regulated membrane protein